MYNNKNEAEFLKDYIRPVEKNDKSNLPIYSH